MLLDGTPNVGSSCQRYHSYNPGSGGSSLGFPVRIHPTTLRRRSRRRIEATLAAAAAAAAVDPNHGTQHQQQQQQEQEQQRRRHALHHQQHHYQQQIQTLCQEGHLDRALATLHAMDAHGLVPSVQTYRHLLKAAAACSTGTGTTSRAAYVSRVHAHLRRHGLDHAGRLGESVVCALTKCGALPAALELFTTLPRPSVVAWTAVMSGHARAGRPEAALAAYAAATAAGVRPDRYMLVAALKACGSARDLARGARVHADAARAGCAAGDVVVGTAVVDMYAKCGAVAAARAAFEALPDRDVVSWNAMLAAACANDGGGAGGGWAAWTLDLYARMLEEEEVSPNDRTLVSVAQACGALAEHEQQERLRDTAAGGDTAWAWAWAWLQKGKAVHAEARRRGHHRDAFLGSALVSMYGKCGSLADARAALEELLLLLPPASASGGGGDDDAPAWNAMMAGYAARGEAEAAVELCERMLEAGVAPTDRTYVALLQACSVRAEKEAGVCSAAAGAGGTAGHQRVLLQWGKVVHAEAWRRGLVADAFVGSALVDMYAKCGSVSDARGVVDGALRGRRTGTVVAWNALLAGYVQHGQPEAAVDAYAEMVEKDGVSPDDRTLVSVLQACALLAEAEDDDTDMDVMMMAAPMDRHYQQQQEVMMPTESSEDGQQHYNHFCCCWNPRAWQQARSVHAESLHRGHAADPFVCSALVRLYGTSAGTLPDAESAFAAAARRTLPLYNAMLTAYARHGHKRRAMELYHSMLADARGVAPDASIFVCLLQACGNTGDLATATQIHHTLLTWDWNRAASPPSHPPPLPSTVTGALIHAYGQCARMDKALAVFHASSSPTSPPPDVVAWTALIAGYARLGDALAAAAQFRGMLAAGARPNAVTFLALLTAYARAGAVDAGLDCFRSMAPAHGVPPARAHLACAVDLAARAGRFDAAQALLLPAADAGTPSPGLAVWMALLAACRTHGNVALGRRAFGAAVALAPRLAPAYVLMATLYAQAGMWEEAAEVDRRRVEAGAWKEPGRSWVRVDEDGPVVTFMVGERGHPQQEQMDHLLQQLVLTLPPIAVATSSDQIE